MPAPNSSASMRRALEILEDEGEITAPELAQACGISANTARCLLRRMTVSTPRCPQRIHIVRWLTCEIAGARNYPRPVYALGAGPAAKKPKIDQKARNKVKWQKQKMRTRQHAASVFALGAQIADQHQRDLAKSRKHREKKNAQAMQA